MTNLNRYIVPLIMFLLVTSGRIFPQYSNVRVTQDAGNQCETAVAVSPSDDNRLLAGWSNHQHSTVGYALSADGGKTWTSDRDVPLADYLPNYTTADDPSVGLDSLGNAYFGYVLKSLGQSGGAIFVSKNTTQDTGFTSANSIKITNSNDSSGEFMPRIAVDNTGGIYNGRIYVCWTKKPSWEDGRYCVHFAFSTDHGLTYSQTFIPEVSDSLSQSDSVNPLHNIIDSTLGVYAMPAVAPDGKVYVVWVNFDEGQIKISLSTDGGTTFGHTTTGPSIPLWLNGQAFGEERLGTIPSLAVAPNGNLCLSYASPNSSTDMRPRVKYSQSIDGGRNWGTPMNVWEPGSGTNLQYFPVINIGGGGIDIAFIYATVANDTVADTYVAVSTNGGTSFDVHQKLSNVDSNPAHHTGSDNIDDYMSVALTVTFQTLPEN